MLTFLFPNARFNKRPENKLSRRRNDIRNIPPNSSGLVVVVAAKLACCSKIDDNNKDNDNNDGNADTQAVPLLSTGRSGLGSGHIEVLVCLNHIRLRFFGLFLDVHDHGLLLHDDFVKVLE